MIPIEYYWLTLILVFGLIGAARGLRRELGATAVLSLSLFALHLGQTLILDRLLPKLQTGPMANFTNEGIVAVYYSATILFVAFISYEGIVLQFPVKEMTGVGKGLFGFVGGLLNGYLIIGTIWNVVADADYLRPQIAVITGNTSQLHNTIVNLLPVSLMTDFSAYIMLIVGMILLLAIILK